MNDREVFEAMDRENRGRKNLSAWEQGRMYDEALKKGLYPSLRRLSESLGVNLSDAARGIQLAKLPKEIVSAFATPLDLQVRWAKPLADALQRDPDAVLARARDRTVKQAGLTSTEIYERLVGKGANASPMQTPILSGQRKVATLKVDSKGRASLEFEAGALLPNRHDALIAMLRDFCA
jgi:ParB family chromosome partitioning protein